VRFGLGLWNSWMGSIIVELAFFAIGLFLYTEATRAADSVGRYGLWSFVVLLLVAWVSTLFAGPPPSVRALAAGALIMWITVPWARWFDHHRFPRPQ
jgi:predicted permease